MQEKDYCFILQQKTVTFRVFRWIGKNVAGKQLPIDKYFVQKPNFFDSQILHRLRE